ncbi:MAG: 2-amino-4-hydroxy-6-hydroxymethyldihydropteridine diphosphokinase [Vampirovibrionales bacterium]|nr:2-amino-4-hydroxy-6-hydroxymethyldihydropteridine diphosphokinase [Vampirovibrionales bacterium]
MNTPYTLYLGLGSNLGNRRVWLDLAIKHLRAVADILALQVSPVFIESAPHGCAIAQGFYLNTVVSCQTHLRPLAVLGICQHIEATLGRCRLNASADDCSGSGLALEVGGKRAFQASRPRTVDIDILEIWHENQPLFINLSPQLIVPHPRLFERDFMRLPLEALKSCSAASENFEKSLDRTRLTPKEINGG